MVLAGSSHSAHTHHWVTRRQCQDDGEDGHIIIIILCVCCVRVCVCVHALVCVFVHCLCPGPYSCTRGQKCHSRLPWAHYAISCLRPQSICWAGSVTEPFHRVTPPAGGRSAERCVMRERESERGTEYPPPTQRMYLTLIMM